MFLFCMHLMFYRYSDHTIEALEMFDNDDKIDLELILALIRHIVLKEEVRLALYVCFEGRVMSLN